MNDRTNGEEPRTERQETPEAAAAHGTRADERIASLDTSPSGLVAQVEELRTQLEDAQQEAAENKAGWQRSAADFANFRRRMGQQRADELGLANESLIRKVVALADDFDLAVEHVPAEHASSPWVDGIAAIDRKLRTLLESEGVTPIQALGKPFDPHEHEAVSHEPTTAVPDGTVLRELQRGYYLRDRVLRPAMVAVAKNESTNPSTTNDRAAGAHESQE
jgi:molecular chaperone GrpE